MLACTGPRMVRAAVALLRFIAELGTIFLVKT
jgi:hypothetical protein